MYQLYNNKIPFLLQDKFTKLEKIKYIVFKTAGQRKLEFGEIKLWNS